MLELSIPNNNVRKQYYEYLLEEYQKTGNMDVMQIRGHELIRMEEV